MPLKSHRRLRTASGRRVRRRGAALARKCGAAAARASQAAIAANLAGGVCRRERARRTQPLNRVGQQSSTWAAMRLK